MIMCKTLRLWILLLLLLKVHAYLLTWYSDNDINYQDFLKMFACHWHERYWLVLSWVTLKVNLYCRCPLFIYLFVCFFIICLFPVDEKSICLEVFDSIAGITFWNSVLNYVSSEMWSVFWRKFVLIFEVIWYICR